MTTTLLDLSKQPDLTFMSQLAGAILAEADALQIPIFMAGAMARDLILTFGYGINTGRATTDVDWAMQVESWEQFAALKAALIDTGRFSAHTRGHQLKYGQNLSVDLVPFGGIENDQGLITWPPDNHTVMSVLGFHEAYQNTITVRLPGNVDIRVVSLASLALLKILAWDERHLIFPKKDAHDFALIARHYTDAGNQDRLYEEFSHLVDAPDLNMNSPAPECWAMTLERRSAGNHECSQPIFCREKLKRKGSWPLSRPCRWRPRKRYCWSSMWPKV